MSFEGLGGLIVGAIVISYAGPLLIAGAATLLAGGATYLVVKAGAAITKGLFSAYSKRQHQRHEQMQQSLKQVGGSLGEAAREQERHIQALIDENNQVYQKAVETRQKRLEEMQKRFQRKQDVEQIEQEMQASLREMEQSVDAVIEEEVTRFQTDLQKSCKRENETLLRKIKEQSADFERRVNQVEAMLDERQERYRAYASETLREGNRLLLTLQTQFDCEKSARALLSKAVSVAQELQQLINEDNVRAAATVAADYEDALLQLQSELTWRTAVYEQQKLCVETAAAELKAIQEAAMRFREDLDSSLTAPGGELEGYVNEQMDIAYWTEGRMPRLFERAQRLLEESSHFEDQRNVTVLCTELRRLSEEIRREHARARAFLVNRMAVLKAAETVIDSMEENGWKLAEDAAYQQGDPRKDFQMVFENDAGDRREVIVCTEYQEDQGKYMIRIQRLAYERTNPDEAQRRAEDQALNDSLSSRGLGSMSVSCNTDTAGMRRMRGGD